MQLAGFPVPPFLAVKYVVVSIFTSWYALLVPSHSLAWDWCEFLTTYSSVDVVEMELKYMKNPECRRNSVRKYKAGNTWVQTGGLPVPTFSFPACSLKLNWLLAIIRRPTYSKPVLSHTPYSTHLGGLGRFSVSQFLLISFISSPLACWRSCQTPKNLRPWKVVLCPFWLYLLCIFYRKKDYFRGTTETLIRVLHAMFSCIV